MRSLSSEALDELESHQASAALFAVNSMACCMFSLMFDSVEWIILYLFGLVCLAKAIYHFRRYRQESKKFRDQLDAERELQTRPTY
jgi:hypothetical protein